MQRADGAPLVALAEGLGYLRAVLTRDGLTYAELGAAISAVYGEIVNFAPYSEGALPLTETAIASVRNVLEDDSLRGKCVDASTEVVGPAHRNNLLLAVFNVRTIMLAEIPRIDTYLVSKKGLFSAPALIEDGAGMLPLNERANMPPAADADLKEGGKCLAFGLWTASGFHGLRAVESLTKAYMKKLDVKASARNWGAYIEALRTSPSADENVVAVLDQIRRLHRNPLLHPEDSLDEGEAITLFGIVHSVTGALLRQLGASLSP